MRMGTAKIFEIHIDVGVHNIIQCGGELCVYITCTLIRLSVDDELNWRRRQSRWGGLSDFLFVFGAAEIEFEFLSCRVPSDQTRDHTFEMKINKIHSKMINFENVHCFSCYFPVAYAGGDWG